MSESPAAGWVSDAPTPAQLKEFFAQVESGRISKDRLQRFLRADAASLKEADAISATGESASVLFEKGFFLGKKLSEYRRFLNWAFGITKFNPRIPDQVPGFDRLLSVPKDIKPSQIIKAMRAKGIVVWTYKSLGYLDAVVSDRPASTSRGEAGEPTEDYAIWLRERQEADEELENLSAIQLKEKGIKGVTLTEQLLNVFFYRYQHKDHPDKQSITLCAGSRNPDGSVPSVRWDPRCGGVGVCWCGPGRAYSHLRCREVVS